MSLEDSKMKVRIDIGFTAHPGVCQAELHSQAVCALEEGQHGLVQEHSRRHHTSRRPQLIMG